MKRIGILFIILCLIFAGAFIFTGCADKSVSAKESKKITAAVTIVPQKTFLMAVCGDLADVVVMVPPGSSPETYEPTPVEMQKLNDAKIYFTIGVPTETGILSRTKDIKTLSIVKLDQLVAKKYPDRTFESGERDPHIWLSPKRVKVMVNEMADEMSKIDPSNKDIYQSNAKAYIDKLDKLDSEIKNELSNVKNNKFIVFHPAFGYFADDYGLEMYALEQEGKEAAPGHLEQMIDLCKKESIKVIFYQEEVDQKQSQAFAQELGGKTVALSPLAEDYTGNLEKMAKTIKEVVNGQ